MLCFKKRLKLTDDQKNIINHLTRNSKAIYNTALYYSKKILSKDQKTMDQYKIYNKGNYDKLDQYCLSSFLQNTYKNYEFMSNHSSQQTIKRVHKSIKSFFELKKVNQEARFPKYKPKNERFNVYFTTNTSKKVKIGDKYYIRLTLGNYIQQNYTNFVKNKNILKFKKTNNYYDSSKLVSKNQIINQLKNVLLEKNNLKIILEKNGYNLLNNDLDFLIKTINQGLNEDLIQNYFSNKFNDENIKNIFGILNNINNGKINNETLKEYISTNYKKIGENYIAKKYFFNSQYMFLDIPKHIYEKKLGEIEIKPLYNGLTYELILKYESTPKPQKIKGKKIVSIDLGINNLMTIFGLNLNPIIINGRQIKSLNLFYKNKITKLQSLLDKKINALRKKRKPIKEIKYTKSIFMNRIRHLFDKRNKIISFKFHKISNYFTNYCLKNNVKTVIIGKNTGWKNKVNIGANNNDIFYKIPYNQLVDKLTYKLNSNEIKVVIHEESFTSKCDALANEPVNRRQHKIDDKIVGKYLGKRIRRGLFKSSTGLTINADVNGAINIYRKALNLHNNVRGAFFNLKLRLNSKRLHCISKVTI